MLRNGLRLVLSITSGREISNAFIVILTDKFNRFFHHGDAGVVKGFWSKIEIIVVVCMVSLGKQM